MFDDCFIWCFNRERRYYVSVMLPELDASFHGYYAETDGFISTRNGIYTFASPMRPLLLILIKKRGIFLNTLIKSHVNSNLVNKRMLNTR